ncbi:MAG: tetratricopeptide repeat protein [Limisphaerales bacterium]
MSGQPPSSGHGFAKLLMDVGLFSGIKQLAHAATSAEGLIATTAALGPAAGVALAIVGGGLTIYEKCLEERNVKKLFPHEPDHHTTTGLNHDLEHALTRATTRTLVALIKDWQELPLEQRGSRDTEQVLAEFAQQCEGWLKNHGDNPASQTIADWIETLDQSAIRAFADLEPNPQLTGARTGELPLSAHFFRALSVSGKWFAEQFPPVFEVHLWDELKKNERAWIAFQGGLHKRTRELLSQANAKLDEQSAQLATQSAELKLISAQLALLREALERRAADAEHPGTALLDNVIQRVFAEIQKNNPALLALLRPTLSDDLVAAVELVIEDNAQQHRQSRKHVEEVVGSAKEELKATFHEAVGLTQPKILPWNPPPRSVGFTGRADELRDMAKLLDQYQRIALVGPGGMGKTALAAEVLFKLAPTPGAESRYPGGIYIHDYYRQSGHQAALAGLLGQAGVDLRTVTDPTAEVRRLFSRSGVLLYLEGCEKADELSLLLELTGQVRVLLTTRDKQKRGDAHPYVVHPLAIEDAAQLLHNHALQASLPDDDAMREPWRKLAGELGRHPLALRLAGAWMQNQSEPLKEFADRLQTERFGDWAAEDKQKANLHLLFQHSAEAVVRKHKKALEAWFGLALHGHAPVPLAVLCGVLEQPEKTVRTMLNALVHYSLAEGSQFPSEQIGQTEPAWQLTHSLLGEWARDQWSVNLGIRSGGADLPLDQNARQRVGDGRAPIGLPRRRAIIRVWRAWWWKDLKRCYENHAVPGGPARYAALQPHWGSLLGMIRQSESKERCELSAEQECIAIIHAQMGNYALAEPLHRRALAACERTLGPEHFGTLGSLNNLAGLLSAKGDLAGAEPLHRRALTVREHTLGPEHPDTLSSLNNLAVLLKGKGDLAGAEPLFQRVLAACERTLGPEHPATLSSLNNLANLLLGKGDLAGAEPLCRRALAVRERTLGPEHPATVSSLNNLATLLKDKGDLAGAEPLHRRALATLERTLGPEHPNTLMSLNNLASLMATKGDLAGAEPLADRAVQGYLAKLGSENPHTKKAQQALAMIREARAKGGKG